MIVDPALAPTSGEKGLRTLRLSVAGGLTQFGAHLDTLDPGAWSSQRHWHAEEDEFLCTLDGVVTLHENDGAHDLLPGTCVCWPAGVPDAHMLENRTERPVTYFVAGSRLPEDEVTYPDIDLHYIRRNGLRARLHKDGTPYPGWPKETNR
ncbi:MAG: cupin domain-containing protein [Tabrizicola sp.]